MEQKIEKGIGWLEKLLKMEENTGSSAFCECFCFYSSRGLSSLLSPIRTMCWIKSNQSKQSNMMNR